RIRFMKRSFIFCASMQIAIGLFLASLSAPATDWPQWRGPQRNGISQEMGLLKEWPKEGPKLRWEIKESGSGYSTPAVAGDRLYALGSDGDLACVEIATGKVRWQKNVRTEFGGKPGTWAYSESPLVDGDVLVCTPGGSAATLVALNKLTGELIWKAAVPGG